MGKPVERMSVVAWAIATGVGWVLAHPLLRLFALEALPLWGTALIAIAIGVGIIRALGRKRQGIPARWWSLGANAGWAALAVVTFVLTHPGSTAALFQWAVLRSHLKNGTRWILAGLVGALLINLVGSVVVANQYESAVIAGILFGIPQWLVLRRHLSRAGWWTAISTLGWLLGGAAATLAGEAYNVSSGYMSETTALVVAHTVPNAIGGSVCGVVTGIGLAWLLRNARPAVTAPVAIDQPDGSA